MRLSHLIAIGGVAAALFVSGCQRDNHPNLPDGPEALFPSVGPAAISTVGGHAHALAGRSAGDSGTITISVTGGSPMLDDDGPRFTPANNFFTLGMLDDENISYAELEAAQLPAIAGGVATFNIGAQGLFLPGDSRLDLSDAPFTGVTPATDVTHVVFIAADVIRIDGDVRTARAGNDAVGISFTSTHTDGVTVDGAITTNAVNGFDAGDVAIFAPNGSAVVLGRVRADGGPATDTLDGGDGGDVGITAGNGNAVLRGGSWRTHGMEGRQDGGSGGNINLTATGAAWVDLGWAFITHGGPGREGDGGDGGNVNIMLDAGVSWYARIDTWGGTTTDGLGGTAGSVNASTIENTGSIRVNADGGASANGDGGDGGGGSWLSQVVSALYLVAYSRGGSGDQGGQGGAFAMDVTALLGDTEVYAWTNGGSGASQGGNGGSAFLTASGPAILRNFLVSAYARGGGSPVQGGVGGAAGVSVAVATAQVSNAWIEVFAQGGNGADGGTGGTAEVFVNAGSAWGTMYADVAGGTASNGIGGTGGQVNLTVDDGNLDFVVDADASGGQAMGGVGGSGGSASLGNSVGASAGSTRLQGSVYANGGVSNLTGGQGGNVQLPSGDGGSSLEDLSVQCIGGSGPDGGPGGAIDAQSSGAIAWNGGTVNVSGGAGQSGGIGGAGGTLDLTTEDGAITIACVLIARGGSGPGGGDGGSIDITTDDDGVSDAGSVVVSGGSSLDARGGDGNGGAGGQGGSVSIDATAADGGGIDGTVQMQGNARVTGGTGAPGGDAGTISIATEGAFLNVTGLLDASGGSSNSSGGGISIADAQLVTIASSARLFADGRGTGLAGTIVLDPAGAGPSNPALVIQSGATLSTDDGDGTDQSATNITLD